MTSRRASPDHREEIEASMTPATHAPARPGEVLADLAIPADDRAALAELLIGAYLLGVDRGRIELAGEQNDAYPPPKVFSAGAWFEPRTERDAWYATARQPRPGDHEGGAVDVW